MRLNLLCSRSSDADVLWYAQVDGLYLMMGRGLDRLKQVPAGCVVAIGGLGTAILKSATLSSTPAARPLAPMLFQVPALHPCRRDGAKQRFLTNLTACLGLCAHTLMS